VIDGESVGTVLASSFRQDLADAGIGDGKFAFAFSTPSPLHPG
jgi:hypothetical protein